jgi:hypothetical protein
MTGKSRKDARLEVSELLVLATSDTRSVIVANTSCNAIAAISTDFRSLITHPSPHLPRPVQPAAVPWR